MVWETQNHGEPDIQLTATCVRVPVLRAHSVSVNIETEKKITRDKAIELLSAFQGDRSGRSGQSSLSHALN